MDAFSFIASVVLAFFAGFVFGFDGGQEWAYESVCVEIGGEPMTADDRIRCITPNGEIKIPGYKKEEE
jgi:hypothetical protein